MVASDLINSILEGLLWVRRVLRKDNMAEDEIMVEDDAIALEDSDDTSVSDIDVTNIIPFVMDRL